MMASCSKDPLPKGANYIETRHSMRILLETTTIMECITNYMHYGVQENFSLITDGMSSTPDTLVLSAGPYNNDARTRTGSLLLTFTGDLKDDNNNLITSFDYYRDSMHITGSLVYQNTTDSLVKNIIGEINIVYLDGNKVSAAFSYVQIHSLGNQQFPKGYYEYTGSFEGQDHTSQSIFSANIHEPLILYECNNYGSTNESTYHIQYIQYGNMILKTTAQGEGAMWFGYNGSCDKYVVVLWDEKEIQLNMNMDLY